MLKIIKKILLLSLFTFSSVVPMRQVAQAVVARTLNKSVFFSNSLVVRCPSIFSGAMEQVVEKVVELEKTVEMQKSDVIQVKGNEVSTKNYKNLISNHIDNKLSIAEQKIVYVVINGEIYGVTVDPATGEKYICCHLNVENHSLSEFDKIKARDTVQGCVCSYGGSIVHDQQLQSHNDSINERIANQDKQNAQHMSQIAYNVKVEAALKAIIENAKLELVKNLVNYSTNVRNEVSKILGSCSSSQHDLQCLKAELNQPLPQLKTKFQSLCSSNSQIDLIVNPEKHGGIRESMPSNASLQDIYKVSEALDLKFEIEVREAAIKAIDSKIQETAHAFENQLKTESSHEIERTITTLVAKKAELNDFAIQKGHELQYRNKQLHDVNDELKSLNNSWVGAKSWRWFSGNEIQKILVEKQQDLVAKIEGIKEGLRLCNAQLQDIETKITQAQNVFFEKQIAEQEAWLAQEKQAQETLSSYNQLIENQHEACTFDLANCPDPGLEKQWNERQDALFQTIDQGYLQYDQAFNLTPETCGFLAAHGIDYKNFQNFYGTALQQQLHQEMCDILSQAGLLQTEFGHSSNLVNSIVDVADAAYDANKSGQVLLASQLIDVDCGLFKLSHEISAAAMSYAQAAVSAVAHGTLDILHIPVDVFHIVAHPSETCKALGKTIGYVLQTAMLNDREILLANPEMFEPLRDQRNAEVAAELKNLGDKIADSSGPEIFEALLRFGTVAVVPEKILSAIGGVCGAVKAEVNIARAGELAAAAGEQVGAEKLAHKVAQAAQKMEQVAQESIAKSLAAELMEAEKVGVAASEARIATRSIAEVLTDIEKFGGKIPLSNVELCKEIETVIKQFIKETNCVIDQSLRQQFVSKWLFENGLKKRVSMDLNHILNYEVKFIKNKKLGMMEIEFSGGHLAGSTEALAETGLIKIINKQQLPTGCWKYDCIDIFTKEKFTKTEFHVSWSKDTIIQQSWNLFENSTISEYVAEGDKLAKYIKLGEQELSIVIKNYEKDINITTSVPYEIPKKKI